MKKLLSTAWHWVALEVHKLFELKDHPDTVALGFAIGIFLGFTPLFGLKTLLALGLAWGLRGSPIAAVLGVTLHDLIIPFAPVLLRIEYQLGYWCLSHPHQFPPKLRIAHLRALDWLSWTTFFKTGGPLLLGSIILGLPIGVLTFFIVRRIVERRQKHARMKAQRSGL